MMKTLNVTISSFIIQFSCLVILAFSNSILASDQDLSQFTGATEDSNITIDYSDVSSILTNSVLDTGRSMREKAPASIANMGTRIKSKRNQYSALEGNRFYYKNFQLKDNIQALTAIRKSLEQIPTEIPLSMLNSNEQLAFWLNLYNITIIEHVSKIYPRSNLKHFLYDNEDGLLQKDVLNVAGVKLSLNDIQFKIVYQNFANKSLLMYGFYQGIIGGPNIRTLAYSGTTVLKQLDDNAEEFVNSNRGTLSQHERSFRVSELYQINAVLFPNFNQDLKKHLMFWINDSEYTLRLENSNELIADISNNNTANLLGGHREFGGSVANNNAALMDSSKRTDVDKGDAFNIMVEGYVSKSRGPSRFSPEVIEMLNTMRMKGNLKNGIVVIKKNEEREIKKD